MSRRTFQTLTALVTATLLGAPQVVRAQSLCTIPLQSYLAGTDGEPLPGPVHVELRFYDGPSDTAAAIDCRSFPATSVDDGWLTVTVNACTLPEPDASGCGVMTVTEILDAGAASESRIFMGIRLGDDDVDAGPRTPLGAVPYAVYATTAASLDGFDPDDYVTVAGAGALFVPRADYDLLADRVAELEDRTESLGDLDGDGALNGVDCEPFDDTIFPGADETPDDTIDSDCDGDSDGDGVADADDCAPFEVDRDAPDGLSADCALIDCLGVLDENPSAETGPYWVTGGSEEGPIRVLCDMHTDGGGWTLCGKFDRDNGAASSLTDPFARSRIHNDNLADVSTFSSQQTSLDCRELIRAGAEWTLSAATDGTAPEWDEARQIPIPAEVIANPTHLWDVDRDEDGIGACADNVMDTSDADGIALGGMDGLANLDNRAGVIGDAAWWTNFARNGAAWSNAGVSDCSGTGDDTVYWAWIAANGTSDDHRCGVSEGFLTIGTGCDQGSGWNASTYRYNLLFMR